MFWGSSMTFKKKPCHEVGPFIRHWVTLVIYGNDDDDEREYARVVKEKKEVDGAKESGLKRPLICICGRTTGALDRGNGVFCSLIDVSGIIRENFVNFFLVF